ncbi:MAG: hypothetical protein ABFD69_09775 [Candidatus Sumerlaeia bacterium]
MVTGTLTRTLAIIFAGSILLTGCAELKSHLDRTPGREPAAPAGAAMPYRIGAAEADITPDWPIMMAGFSARKKPSEGTYDQIRVRAMTIDDGKTRIVYIMGDLASWDRRSNPRPAGLAPAAGARSNAGNRPPSAPPNIIKSITEQLRQSNGIDPDNVIFVASHSHSGPVLNDEKFKPMLISQTVKCAQEALANAREARLFFGRGTTRVGVSRRGRDLAGEDRWEINPYAQHDHEVVVLKAVDRAGRPIGVIFNYGCHPSMMGSQLIGADFVGFAATELKQRLGGAPALFLQGSGGDAKPVNPTPGKPFLFLPNAQTDVAATKARGVELADDVCEVLGGKMDEITGPIRYGHREVELPVMSAWKGSGRWLDAGSAVDPDDPLSGPRRRMARYAKMMLDSMDEKGNYKETQRSDIYCVRIGDEFIHVGMSGEICSPIGLRVKDELRGCKVMFTGYTGYMNGYIPAQNQITAGGYEVFSNPHRKPYSLEMEDMLVCDTIDLVESVGPKIPDLNPPQ